MITLVILAIVAGGSIGGIGIGVYSAVKGSADENVGESGIKEVYGGEQRVNQNGLIDLSAPVNISFDCWMGAAIFMFIMVVGTFCLSRTFLWKLLKKACKKSCETNTDVEASNSFEMRTFSNAKENNLNCINEIMDRPVRKEMKDDEFESCSETELQFGSINDKFDRINEAKLLSRMSQVTSGTMSRLSMMSEKIIDRFEHRGLPVVTSEPDVTNSKSGDYNVSMTSSAYLENLTCFSEPGVVDMERSCRIRPPALGQIEEDWCPLDKISKMFLRRSAVREIRNCNELAGVLPSKYEFRVRKFQDVPIPSGEERNLNTNSKSKQNSDKWRELYLLHLNRLRSIRSSAYIVSDAEWMRIRSCYATDTLFKNGVSVFVYKID